MTQTAARETFQVAMVVFATVEGADRRDAANRAERIIDAALLADQSTASITGTWSVNEIGTAMRNGMLRIDPT